MKKSDLIWAICEIDEDLLRLTEENPVMKKRHTRPVRVLLIAAAIAALLAGTVLAYAIRHWDELFVESFQMEDSEKELLDGALQDVYAQTTQDGVTCTLKQVLGNERCLVVALEIQLPDTLETGTTSAEELSALAGELDLPKDPEESGSLDRKLSQYFGYDPEQTEFPDAPYLGVVGLFPVDMEKDDLLAAADARCSALDVPEAERSGVRDSIGAVIFDEAMKDYNSFGGGTIRRSYDPETRTLTALDYVESSGSLVNRPYTLVIDQLYLYSMLNFISPEDYPGAGGQELLTSPIVLNFTADYQPQSQTYDILQDGAVVGTLELSPVSAHLTFPQEPDDPNRLAPNRHDYLKDNGNLSVRMTDGQEIELRERSDGFTDVQFAFYIAGEIIDLSQVQEVCLGSYTLQLQTAEE